MSMNWSKLLEKAAQSDDEELLIGAARAFIQSTNPAMLDNFEEQTRAMPKEERKPSLVKLLIGWSYDLK